MISPFVQVGNMIVSKFQAKTGPLDPWMSSLIGPDTGPGWIISTPWMQPKEPQCGLGNARLLVRDMGWSHQIQLHVILQALNYHWISAFKTCMIYDPNVQWSIKKVSLKLFKSPLKTTHANFGLEKDPCKIPMTYLKQRWPFPKTVGNYFSLSIKSCLELPTKKETVFTISSSQCCFKSFLCIMSLSWPVCMFVCFFPCLFQPFNRVPLWRLPCHQLHCPWSISASQRSPKKDPGGGNSGCYQKRL